MTLEQFNALDADAARDAVLTCCRARTFAEHVCHGRPFATRSALLAAASAAWGRTTREQKLEAFRGHPRIGGRDALRAKFAPTRAWSLEEQSRVASSDDDTLSALERGNAEYEALFGYIFIVSAYGKSALEMLTLLRARMNNDPALELQIAAAEQEKIMLLRLEKLIP